MKYEIEKRLSKIIAYKPIDGKFKVRLDANESFFPMPDSIINEFSIGLKEIEFNRYPDPYACEICKKFADIHNIAFDSVVAGNGSDELINLIIQVFLKDGEKVLTLSPDFSMYRFYSELRRAEVIAISTPYDRPVNITDFIETVKYEKPKMVIFSNPCNPTGQLIVRDSVKILTNSCPEVLFVVDEAYMDFSDQSILSFVEELSNVIVLRTMSKAFAAASIRLGFALSNKILIDTLKKVKAPYNINSVTQKMGSILLSHADENRERINKIIEMRESLFNGLKKYIPIIKIFPSGANFIFIQSSRAREIYDKLLLEGIAIRYFNNDTLRITAGNTDEQEMLFSCLDRFLK